MEKLSPENKVEKFVKLWRSSELYVTVSTSGSTGKPKQIKLSKEAMRKSALLTGEFLGLKRGDKALLCLPVDFIAGKMMVVRAEVLGLNLTIVPPSSNPEGHINKDFDFAAMTPMQVHNILNGKEGYYRLNRIKKLIIGGGGISAELLKKIAKLSNDTYHTYGMTETITNVAMKRLNGNEPDRYFKALKNISFGQDERGCLVINAPHIQEKKIVTNDIVRLVNKVEFDFLGRFDNIINTGGIKVFPEVVENKLSRFFNERFVVSGVDDKILGNKVVLIIEKAKGNPEEYFAKISKAGLSKYETPKEIFFVQELPEAENGKIDRNRIKMTF